MLSLFLLSLLSALILLIAILLQPPHAIHLDPETLPAVSASFDSRPFVPLGPAAAPRSLPFPSPQPTATRVVGAPPVLPSRVTGTPGPRQQEQDWHTRPVVSGFLPASENDVSPYTNIQVTFGIPVDRRSAERAFTISPPVAGHLRWTGDEQLIFEPVAPLDYATMYRVGFAGELRDSASMPLPAPLGHSFTTGPAQCQVQPQD